MAYYKRSLTELDCIASELKIYKQRPQYQNQIIPSHITYENVYFTRCQVFFLFSSVTFSLSLSLLPLPRLDSKQPSSILFIFLRSLYFPAVNGFFNLTTLPYLHTVHSKNFFYLFFFAVIRCCWLLFPKFIPIEYRSLNRNDIFCAHSPTLQHFPSCQMCFNFVYLFPFSLINGI